MGERTDIQWCDSTVNPTMGCDGCEIWNSQRRSCYAGVMHGRYRGANKGFAKNFNVVEQFPGRMAKATRWSDLRGAERPDKPWLNGMPRLIFVSDMSDALSKNVPFDYLDQEIIGNVCEERGRRHCWLWLTKQARRMAMFSALLQDSKGWLWPSNLWAGTSVTTQETAKRLGYLASVGNDKTTRFVSAEPLLGPLDLQEHFATGKIHWCIIGGESGADARPCHFEWIESLISQCREFGVGPFVKQLGTRPRMLAEPYTAGCEIRPQIKDSHGGDWDEWPEHLRVREMPKVGA